MNNNRIVSKISGQVQCFSHPRYIPKFADSSYIPQLYFPIAVSSCATQSTHTPKNIILNHLVPTIWKHELMKTGRRTKNREYHIDLYWKPKKETNKKNKQTQNNFTPIVSKQETPSRNQEKSHWQKITTGLHQKSVDVKNQNAKYQKKKKNTSFLDSIPCWNCSFHDSTLWQPRTCPSSAISQFSLTRLVPPKLQQDFSSKFRIPLLWSLDFCSPCIYR